MKLMNKPNMFNLQQAPGAFQDGLKIVYCAAEKAGSSRGLGECDTAMTSHMSPGPQADTDQIYPHQTYRCTIHYTLLSNTQYPVIINCA